MTSGFGPEITAARAQPESEMAGEALGLLAVGLRRDVGAPRANVVRNLERGATARTPRLGMQGFRLQAISEVGLPVAST